MISAAVITLSDKGPQESAVTQAVRLLPNCSAGLPKCDIMTFCRTNRIRYATASSSMSAR